MKNNGAATHDSEKDGKELREKDVRLLRRKRSNI